MGTGHHKFTLARVLVGGGGERGGGCVVYHITRTGSPYLLWVKKAVLVSLKMFSLKKSIAGVFAYVIF